MTPVSLPEYPDMQSMEKLAKSLMEVCKDQQWPSEDALTKACDEALTTLHDDLEKLNQNAGVLLGQDDDSARIEQDMETLFASWHHDKSPPSLLALCLFAVPHIAPGYTPDDFNMLATAAMLGQVTNDVPYHNNAHFRKVVAHTILMTVTHNKIFADMPNALNAHEVCKMLAAACIHDLSHDGQGNWVKGVHIEGRAEKLSFDQAKPYLKNAGATDKALDDILVMLLTTDVTPLDDPGNPMKQMKAAYRYHFMGEDKKAHTLNLSDDIKALEKDKTLSTLCLILHEADIATSAGMTYEVTKYETALLIEEFRDDRARPSQVVDFLDQICQRRFLSDAGQKLYAANLARIYSLAEQDVANGDEPYPSSNMADFVLPHAGQAESKTIN